MWSEICPDSLVSYNNYYPSLIYIIGEITWNGFTDWIVGSKDDYKSIAENLEEINPNITPAITNGTRVWTSSSVSGDDRYEVRFLQQIINSFTGAYRWYGSDSSTDDGTDRPVWPIRYF